MPNIMSKVVTALSAARLYVVISSIVALAAFGFGLHFGAMLGSHVMSALWLSIAVFAILILGVFTARNLVALCRASWGSIMRIIRNAFWGMGILVLDYLVVAFILNRPDGAWLRGLLSKFSVPDGNLLMAAGPIGWTFLGLIALCTVFGAGPYIWAGVKLWFRKRFIMAKPRAASPKQPKQGGSNHDYGSIDDFRRQLHLDLDDETEDDPDATHDIGAQLHLSR